MAYPYYTPNYQQYQPYQQTYLQPVYQQTQPNYQNVAAQTAQAVSPIQNQSSIIWISGDQEAQMYPVAPNNAVTLWSQNEPVVYLKQADATGKPTLKTYDLVERVQAAPAVSNSKGNTVPAYATKDELTAVVGVVKEFDTLIGNLKSDIDAMKTDIYGIAGKKKTPTRKPKVEEVEDDE